MAQEIKVSDQKAQKNTAIFLQIVYAILYTLIGVPLLVIGIIGLANPKWADSSNASQTHWQIPGWEGPKNAYIAAIVVGAILLIAVAYSIWLSYQMVQEQKNDGSLSTMSTVSMACTLNFYGMIMALTSNGKLRTSEEKKADKDAKKQKKADKKSAKLASKKQTAKPAVATA